MQQHWFYDVWAFIGAGGLGSIMFQGVFANAAELTVLGAMPVILLAIVVDGLLRMLTGFAERRHA